MNSINSTFPINLITEAWTRKWQSWLLWGTQLPPELFWQSRWRGEPQNNFGHDLHPTCAFSMNLKVLYTRKVTHYQIKNFIYIQGERWLSQPFLGSEKPSSPANKAFMFPFFSSCRRLYHCENSYKNKNVVMSWTLLFELCIPCM